MMDPLVNLAFAVHSNPGVYSLLLGSGVSRAAGIPTGWEVVIDLISKVAAAEGETENCEPDPAAWYKNKFNEEPDYSVILDRIAKEPAERQQILKAYFEPTPEEREEGLKLPTQAHVAIAKMVADGKLRVILTTNFDRLMEKALDAVGVTPTVISNADQLAGALPLVHSGATVIKLHGDYLDTRIKNTETELAAYDASLNSLLDRVIDEYGLIISGWSGDWDLALRAAIERSPNRRFTTFWTSRGDLSEKADALAKHRSAVVLKVAGADELFGGLEEKVAALARLEEPGPLSAAMAAATVKRCLGSPDAEIRLHDLINRETERVCSLIGQSAMPFSTTNEPKVEVNLRVKRYRAATDTLLAANTTAAYWLEDGATGILERSHQRAANPDERRGGTTYLISLQRYPALLLFYATGIACVAAKKYQSLQNLLVRPSVREFGRELKPFYEGMICMNVMEENVAKLLSGQERKYTPVQNFLVDDLREVLREYAPEQEAYEDLFDRFEYFLGLTYASLTSESFEQDTLWGPVGRFGWRRRVVRNGLYLPSIIDEEIEQEGEAWAPFRSGLFGGDLEICKQKKKKYDAFLIQVCSRWH